MHTGLTWGIDPGIRNTGYAVLTPQLEIVVKGFIQTASKLPTQARIKTALTYLDDVKAACDLRGHFSSQVVIEQQVLFRGRRKRYGQFDKTIAIYGALMAWAIFHHLEVVIPTAVEWQATLVTGGRGRKEVIHEAVNSILKQDLPDHVTDAIGLAVYGIRKA